MSLNDRPLRWGILGCGNICQDFASALSSLPKESHMIQHVAARDGNRAETFAKRFEINKSSGDYKMVLQDDQVDVVYIGTINTTHKDLTLLALNHKKSVLCEKPATMNSEDLKEVLKCAKENNTFYMEAVWTRCFPLYHDILTKITSGEYGEPCVLLGTFGHEFLMKVDRVSNPQLGGGILTDIGIYLLTAADIIFSSYKLKDFKACGHLVEETGVDRSVAMSITYEGNKVVQLMASGDNTLRNEIEIICSNAKLTIKPPFWCPEEYEVVYKNGETKVFKFPLPKLKTNFVNSAGLSYEADHVRECLLKGLLESPLMDHSTSLKIMGYVDEAKKQMGR